MVVKEPKIVTRSTREKENGAFFANNRAYAQENFTVAVPPSTDYLCMSIFAEPEHIDAIKEWLPAHEFYSEQSLYLSRGNIHAHGRAVGKIAGCKSAVSRYGKKLLFHFRGEWFRSPVDGRGAGYTERRALQFMRLFCNYLVKEGVVPSGFLRFIGIDRWDVCLELETKKRVWDVAESITLPGRWHAKQGEWSEDGFTVYCGTTGKPKANRGTHPHLAIYRKLDRPDRLRVEARIPRVRNVDPTRSIGQEGAADLIAILLDCFAPERLEVGELPENVTALDFADEAVPEEVIRRPYWSHPPDTLRRMMRMSCTTGIRSIRATVAAKILSRPEIMETLDMADLYKEQAYREMFERAGLPSGEERQYPDHVENLSYAIPDDLLDTVDPKKCRPFDYGANLLELAAQTPLNLDEIYEWQSALWDLQRITYPDALPYHEVRGQEIASTRVTNPYKKAHCATPGEDHLSDLCTRCDDTMSEPVRETAGELLQTFPPINFITSVIQDDLHFVRRYLEPIDHEPLRTTRRWQAMASPAEISFFRPTPTGALYKAGVIEFGEEDE